MREVFAYIDTGVSVMLPDHIDVESEEAYDMIRAAFRDLIMSQEAVDFLVEEEPM